MGLREANMTTNQETTRDRVPENIVKELKYQIQSLSRADLSEYTYEHKSSDYKGANDDYSIYDPSGKLILKGRGFGRREFFWTPVADSRLVEA